MKGKHVKLNSVPVNLSEFFDQELKPFTWVVLPILLFLFLLLWSFTIPEMVMEAFRDDLEGGGIVEHGTVIFLVFAVAVGVFTLVKYNDAFPNKWIRYYIVMWILGSLFFAGEEASWGQHYFGWESPEIFEELNTQQETNIHNMSSWFNQKPRLLVEICVMYGGLILPLIRLHKKRMAHPNSYGYWLFPTFVCIPITALIVWLRLFEILLKALDLEGFMLLTFGSAEYREYNLAIFFLLFLMSIAARAHAIHKAGGAKAIDSAVCSDAVP